MTDRYEHISEALEALDAAGGDWISWETASVKYAKASQPDTIRALLAERDALREALAALKAENEMLREALKDADNEMDWLDEDMDTCDHSVGVCACSYWSVRRKMKAALAKENSND